MICTIAENLISPCKNAFLCKLGEDVRKMNTIPLSNYRISRIIQDMSDIVKATVIGRNKDSIFFAIQVDESTDVAYFTVLLVIARYLKGNGVEENLLLCHPLSNRRRDVEIWNATDCYFN
jgi:hypothetical protein